MKFEYCPLCGNKLIEKYSWDEGGVPYCVDDNIMYFDTPKPCIVVAIIKDEYVLLLKQSYIFKNSKVLLSGYVCSGETIEGAVHREVKEEAGIYIKNLKYLGSDYLENKDIVMLTFMARYKEGQLKKSKEVEWLDWIPLKEAISHMEEDIVGKKIINKILEYSY